MHSIQGAAAFANRAGIALVFPSADLVLPSLWEATTGTSEVTVFARNEQARRVLTPELRRVWSWHTRLGEQRLACVGKHVRGRLALVSLETLPALYALTGRSAHTADFREPGLLSALELELAEALLDAGPSTAPELRGLLGLADPRTTKRALERLQRLLVATQAGEAEQEHGWSAAVFDLVARRYHERLRRLPDPDSARRELVACVLASAGELSAADAAAALGLTRAEAEGVLAYLADEGRASRREEQDVALWSPAT